MKKLQRIVNTVVLIAMVVFVGYCYITFPRFPLTSFPAYVTLFYSIPFLLFLAIFNGVILSIRYRARIKSWKENTHSDTNFPDQPQKSQRTIL